MFPKWLGGQGARAEPTLVALNAQIPQTHALFVMLGETRARAFLDHTINRLAHRAAAASGLVARMDMTSLLALFENAESALTAACALRDDLRQWVRTLDGELRLDLDMGLSCGAVLCRPPLYEGNTILRAASLATAASDGQILLDAGVMERLPRQIAGRLIEVRSSGPDGDQRAWLHDCAHVGAMQRAPSMWMHLRSPDGSLNMSFGADRPIRIGRDARADVVLDAPGISRQHAVITWRNGYYTLTDTSQNGTWVRYARGSSTLHVLHNVCLLEQTGTLTLGEEPGARRTPDLLFSVARAENPAETT